MLWIKSFHIIFVVSWFAGLFYLPRLFVNLALETDPTSHARLLLMARKLFRFTTLLAFPAVFFGMCLFVGYGIGLQGPGNGWMHAKLALVVVVIGYHVACGSALRSFEAGVNRHGDRYYRVFNEVSVLLLAAIVILVVVQPF